jgi:hypothetical protein
MIFPNILCDHAAHVLFCKKRVILEVTALQQSQPNAVADRAVEDQVADQHQGP